MSKFRLNCKTLFLTYKGHIDVKKFKDFKGLHKICQETGDSGYKHTHALLYYRKKFDIRNERHFDIGDIHPNIKKVLSKNHWVNLLKYVEKEGKIIKNTLSGNEYLWKGEVRDAIQQHKRWNDVLNDSSLESHIQKHFQWAKAVYDAKPRIKILEKEVKLKKWQLKAIKALEKQNNREILWIYDRKGGKGKSWLTDYILDNYDSIMMNGGKLCDMAYAYDNQEYVIFDLPRSMDKEFTPYRAMECFKDGRIFSSKYQSIMKRFKKCKVIVFSNHSPDTSKLSEDRWKIWDLGKSGPVVPPTSLNIKARSRVRVNNVKKLSKKELKRIFKLDSVD